MCIDFAKPRMFCKGLLGVLMAVASLSPAWAHGDNEHASQRLRSPHALAAEQQAWGIAAKAATATRTVHLSMSDDMRFTPGQVEVRQGETVKFVIRNAGRVLHEWVLGTKDEIAAHAAMMKKHPDMEHDEPWMVHVQPGRQTELVWRFNRSGTFQFACLLPGHYDAGMVGTVVVTPVTDAFR